MSSIKRQLEWINLVLPIGSVGIGLITFGIFVGAQFADDIEDVPVVHAGLATIAVILVLLAGLLLGRLTMIGLRSLAKEASEKLVSANAKIEALERMVEEPVHVPTDDDPALELKSTDNLPPPSVQVWLRRMESSAEVELLSHSSFPICVIANLKGGVAKTMTAANLAAYFATRNNFDPLAASVPTLLVDLDYQGSLSNMVLNAFGAGTRHPRSLAQSLFDPAIKDIDCLHYGVRGTAAAHELTFFPTEYGFDDFETRAQFDWLSGANPDDVRLLLSRRLRSQAFQDEFGIAFLDTGPRLTTGSVGALAAATHLLLPTASDLRSITATIQFLRRVAEMRERDPSNSDRARICPQLRVAGILQTLSTNRQSDRELQENARATLISAIEAEPRLQALFVAPDHLVFDAKLPRSQPIVDQAEIGLPYLENGQTRTKIGAIGRELERILS